MERPLILQMQGITRLFPGIHASDDMALEVREGDIHAICGENRAGKSTSMRALSDVYPHGPYEGRIIYMENEVVFRNIKESERAGIAIIH